MPNAGKSQLERKLKLSVTSSAVREAMERTSAAIAADPGKAKARNVPATVGCTLRNTPACTLEIEVGREA